MVAPLPTSPDDVPMHGVPAAPSPGASLSSPGAVPPLDLLESQAALAVARDNGEDSDAVDEDEDGAVTDLVEHMSNIAVVM